MTAPVRLIDRITVVTPLGVRFFDPATERFVTEGLTLTELGRGVRARPNGAGYFVASGLPGLREEESGTGDEEYWSEPPPRLPFTFELGSSDGRFLPYRFKADLPQRSALGHPCAAGASPPSVPAGALPLFSAPTRPLPAGTAAVRAELRDVDTGEPAVWALLEVRPPGEPGVLDMADERGRVLVPIAYPEPPAFLAGSPPPGTMSLSDQTWQLAVSVRYGPGFGSPPLPGPDATELPDLCSLLEQPPADPLASESPLTVLGADTLAYGRELLLHTQGLPVLLVSSNP